MPACQHASMPACRLEGRAATELELAQQPHAQPILFAEGRVKVLRHAPSCQGEGQESGGRAMSPNLDGPSIKASR